jgi:formylglycine-generating enzyme required for sulfatase activity
LKDVAILAEMWSETGCVDPNRCKHTDIDFDGQVGYNDLSFIAGHWLESSIPENMVQIPAGEFEMGDHHDGISHALPVHAVYVDSFYMSKFEVTNQEYCDYLNSALSLGLIEVNGGLVYPYAGDNAYYCNTTTSSSFSRITWDGNDFGVVSEKQDHPMVEVSWYGSVAYCNWRSQREGYQACYDLATWDCDFSKKGHRLATQAEWEYAARSREHSPYYRYPWGDSIDGSMANYQGSGDPFETGDDTPWTTPVGYYDGNQTPAGSDMVNGYGLYDMTGNVWEWCNDWWDSNYYSVSPYDNPQGPNSGIYRVVRGGSWQNQYYQCRIVDPMHPHPVARVYFLGFRVVLDLN